jgi:quinol monooxygenase YgiN
MPITSIVEFPPVEDHDPREGYDRVTRQLNDGRSITRRSEFGEGLLAHVHSIAEDGGVVVVEVWQDQARMDAFIQRLQPILEREGFADLMSVRVLETHNVVTDG